MGTDSTLAPAPAGHVSFTPSGLRLACQPGQSILDAALAAGHFPKHSCRRGECLACAAPLLAGVVDYPDGFSAPAGLAAGHCLTCLARPQGEVCIAAPEVALQPGRRVQQFGARVISNTRVSRDVAIVRLQAPAGFDFAAGQYLDVILRDGARRSYSLANAPDASGVLEWHVRAMPGGRFSNHVYQTLKARDMLRVEGPFGSFQLSASNRPAILLASGTGYAPIAALLRTHGEELAARGAWLYWGGRQREDIYAWEQAEDLCVGAGLRFIPVLSEAEPGWTGRTGLVHEAVLQDFLDLAGAEVYACGNPLMVEAARVAFTRRRDLPAPAFFSDAFLAAPAPAAGR